MTKKDLLLYGYLTDEQWNDAIEQDSSVLKTNKIVYDYYQTQPAQQALAKKWKKGGLL